MAISRRDILAGFAAATVAAAQDALPPAPPLPPGVQTGPRVPRPRTAPKPRTTPAVCLYSQHLIKVEYEAVGMVLRDLGFDGCNMAIVPGSHLEPSSSQTDLMRAMEAVSGVGLEVAIVTMPATSGNDPLGRQILGIAGFMGVPLFRPGYWKYANPLDINMRLAQVQRDLFSLASVGRAYNLAMAVHNAPGDNVGAGIADINGLISGVDPRWVGFDFDPGFSTETAGLEGAELAQNIAQPRMKAVTVRDFTWSKDDAGPKTAIPCPLGQGIVDWGKFFAGLAHARFVGPITIEVRYQPKDEIIAFRRDLEFVRKQIAAAY
jgi:sugar phosphate isomerase/epimerase